MACEGQTPQPSNHVCAFMDSRDDTCDIEKRNQREAKIPVTMDTAKLNLGLVLEPEPADVCQAPASHDVFHFPFPLVKIDTHRSGVVTPEAAL